jgi:hypothetical protein
MLAQDPDVNFTQYRTWVVDGEPDLTAQYYTGLKAGDNPLINISAYAILDNNVVANFNYPQVNSFFSIVDWVSTKKVLPESIYDGQIVVVDGYVDGYDGYEGYAYLLGGKYSDKIYRARLSRPTEWEDTGATLPNYLSGAQLAIIGDKIYLFGGSDTQSLDNIYSAEVTNPLIWTDHGSLLPRRINNAQLAIVDGYIYLFGGYEITHPTAAILRASAADPLTWVDTGNTLPIPLYNSHLAIIDNNIYLYGGQNFDGYAINSIFVASTSNPLSWSTSLYNLPYEICGGQFFTVGEKGFMISPGSSPGGKYRTSILQCNLNAPLQWGDTGRVVPGNVSFSHLAIIYDRIFLFGGNGSSVIFADNNLLKYNFTDTSIVAYGNVTRTQYNNTLNKLDLFRVLGFAPWKTDYGA